MGEAHRAIDTKLRREVTIEILLPAFVAAMLAHPTVEAAAAAGISPATAYRWLQHPDVVQRLAEARRDAMKAAMAKLQQAASASVDCLCEIQREGESESARVSAARCILEQALRTVELQDVQERIEKLEAIVKSRNWKGAGSEQPGHAQVGKYSRNQWARVTASPSSISSWCSSNPSKAVSAAGSRALSG